MLDRLIESGSHRQQKRGLRLFFLGTATLVITGCLSVFTWSIMAMELNLTDDGLELSTLVAPVPVPAEPPKPEPVQEQQQQTTKSEVTIRNSVMDRVDTSREIPDAISTKPNTQKEMPKSGAVRIGPGPEIDGSQGIEGRNPGTGGGPTGPIGPSTTARKDDDDVAPVMENKAAEVKKVTIVHSSIINGKATNLPKPNYPPTAVAVNAAGQVNVQVTLDEAGNVISAKAVSGHALLRASAEQAARNAKFSPTILNGQRVKVTGLIVYNFTRNG